jgi:uncharacterized protein (DUF952 family)
MLIFKIFRAGEWRTLYEQGETTGAPIDVTDGYIHFSTAEQIEETAAKHFTGEDGLMVLALDPRRLDTIKWEPSRGGALFPHLYRNLRLGDVLWARPVLLGPDGTHIFPDGVE